VKETEKRSIFLFYLSFYYVSLICNFNITLKEPVKEHVILISTTISEALELSYGTCISSK